MQSCGNPLYLQWVSEWMQEAKEKNHKSYNIFKTAYNSLLTCPITFSEPREAKKLKGIGDIICSRIEKRLKEYQQSCVNEDLEKQKVNTEKISIDSESQSNQKIIQKSQKTNKTKTRKTYIPSYKSKPFSILIALLNFDESTSVSKEEILNIAKHYHDTSNDKNIYSIWDGMKILLEKEYVYKTINPTKYYLTDSGREIANTIANLAFPNKDNTTKSSLLYNENIINQTYISKNQESHIKIKEKLLESTSNVYIPNITINPEIIQQNSYSIILLLDLREVKTEKDKEFIQDHLKKESVNFEFKTLELGDILWIARCNITKKDYILDFIVERKKLNDLASSIKDGRFHEQKFRLSKSGLKHIIYIIENYNYDSTDLHVGAIQSAISSTQVINGFFVKRVSGLTETIKYIARLTRYISYIYKTRDLYIIPDSIDSKTYTLQKNKINSLYPERSYVIEYNIFSDFLSKTASLTLSDLFLKMLLTIKGVSPEKAIEIQKHFPTLNDLLTSYSKETSEYQREIMIAKKCTNYGRKNISYSLSSKIYKVFQ
ncbi:hypothetical protein PORY_002115 [Pneumocystis oryctolagi]|uniref:Uncharacterized protein n=1 Tax=Pneumocystis oryctolagi TaxID=42067 RepID=A0ACB7CBI5_9ASCO|nr:hypothetical protein PORY_002115 [Pneumocystis oryctolagi]